VYNARVLLRFCGVIPYTYINITGPSLKDLNSVVAGNET
jgi:hypothetical protein